MNTSPRIQIVGQYEYAYWKNEEIKLRIFVLRVCVIRYESAYSDCWSLRVCILEVTQNLITHIRIASMRN